MSAEDYLSLGETEPRCELINGVVVMSPSPRPRHAKVILELAMQLGNFAASGGSVDAYTETDLQINDLAVFRPDICAYANAPGKIPERLTVAPDLVVEVLSPGSETLDFITKRDEYERRGVKEYWVIDPADARVRAWRLVRGRLIEALVEGDSFASTGIPGFDLDIARIRAIVTAS
jgi:Uma2 family endonuclease